MLYSKHWFQICFIVSTCLQGKCLILSISALFKACMLYSKHECFIQSVSPEIILSCIDKLLYQRYWYTWPLVLQELFQNKMKWIPLLDSLTILAINAWELHRASILALYWRETYYTTVFCIYLCKSSTVLSNINNIIDRNNAGLTFS